MPILKNNYIFVHIPKTGGVSVYFAMGGIPINGLGSLYGAISGDECKSMYGCECVILQHLTAEQIMCTRPQTWKMATKFTFVRNPYDRFVSAWEFPRREKWAEKHPCYNNVKSFDDFTKIVEEYILAGESSQNGVCHYYPQTHYLSIDGEICDSIQIFRYEQFGEGLKAIYSQWSGGAELKDVPHANKSKRSFWQGYYNKTETVERVQRLYRHDFKNLGYSMEIQ